MSYSIAEHLRAAAETAPILGPDAAMAFDSAPAMFRAALRAMNVPNSDRLATDALRDVFNATRGAFNRRGAASRDAGFRSESVFTNDEMPARDDFAKRFPNVAAVRRI